MRKRHSGVDGWYQLVDFCAVRLGGSAELKFSPAVINEVTLSACLTTALIAHREASRKSHSMFHATKINKQLIEFTTLASGAAARTARLFEVLAE